MESYTYSISTDFPNGKVAADKLAQEIQQSAIVTALDRIDTTSDICDVWFKAELSAGDKTILDGVVAAHDGEPIKPKPDPKSPSGFPLIIPEPREGSSVVIVSHNWCDPTTWYGQSVRVTGETLADSGDGLTFNSAHQHWIDLSHGKIYQEDRISAAYLPNVYIDGVKAVERTPFADSGGDFVIDYATGSVTFSASQAGKMITADYNYENGSRFLIAPDAGKILNIEDSEVQFSGDIVMNDTIYFQAWAYDPNNPPNKVPVSQSTVYKMIRDFVDEARGVYPEIPAIGGAKRGLAHSHVDFPFNYKTIKELVSSYGLEVRVWLEKDIPMGGEFATATFYCTSKSET